MERSLRNFLRFSLLVLLISYSAGAQVNFLSDDAVYDFLERFDAQGLIRINHHQKPLSRKMIYNHLKEIERNPARLSSNQKEELKYFLSEYNYSNSSDTLEDNHLYFLEKNSNDAFRIFEYSNDDKRIVIYPDAGLDFSYRNSEKHSYTYYNGLSSYGSFGKYFSFDFDFNDVSIKREGYPVQTLFSSERGFDYPRFNRSNETLNYDRTLAAITMSWSWGFISLKKDYNYWGTGNSGKLILSDKAPSYPQLYVNAKPFDWLEFGYFYGELNSSINDSSTIRNSGGTRPHIQLVEKYIAAHIITFDILNNIKLSVGESVIISDRFEPIYLIPVLFFRLADHYISHTDYNSGNAQVFSSVSYRLPQLSSRFDFSVFIDELKVTDLSAPSAIGYSIGLSNYDVLLNNLSIHSEYVKIDPFVYLHGDPAQTYANRRYTMGHWIGSNSDMVNLSFKYVPLPKFRVNTSLSYIRKGDFEDITQPRYQPDQEFLFGEKSYYLNMALSLNYEILNNIFLEGSLIISNSWGKNNRIQVNDHKFTELGVGVKTGF